MSRQVMLGIAAIAIRVIATITLVQYRETSTCLTAVREHEGRRFAAALAFGFDRELTIAPAEQGGSLGLLGMRERAGLVGGTHSIDSIPGRGTAVRVVLPLASAAGDPEAERRSA